MLRKDVPEELTWNLNDIYADQGQWEAEYEAVEQALTELLSYRDGVGNESQDLLAYLRLRDDLIGRLSRLCQYAFMLVYEDGTNTDSQALNGRARWLQSRVKQILTQVRSDLLELPEGLIEQFMKETDEFREYQWYLERLLTAKAHRLSPEAEDALSAVDQVLSSPHQIYESMTSSDFKFDSVLKGDGKEFAVSLWSYFTQVETSPDNVLRRNAFRSLTDGLSQHQHGVGTVMATEIQRNVAIAKLRRYNSTAEFLLNDSNEFYQADHAPVQVFEQALDIIQAELAPHMQRYARLRKRVLGLDKLLYCDVKAPLDVTFNPHVTFKEAGRILTEAVGVLGDEYQDRMHRAITERWVYQADNVGRGMIAFGDAVYGIHGYSFLPWGGNLYDVPVLGHELGHAVHLDLAGRAQRATNTMPAMLFAEAPSTLNEHLIVNYMRKTSDDPKLLRWLDMYLMMSYHHNFVTHILEAELLRRLYRIAEANKGLSAGIISDVTGEVLANFWGDTVEIDDGAKLIWMRQPHYYYGLYPYTYSVGLAASTVLAERIEKEGQVAGREWVEVLKLGGSRSAFDLFKAAELDIASPDLYRNAVAFVGGLVERLEQSFRE